VYSVGHSSALDRSSFIVIVLFLLPPPVPLSVYSVGHSSDSRFFVFDPPIPKAATDLLHSPAAQLTAHCLFPHGQIPSHFLRTAAFKIPLQRFDQDRQIYRRGFPHQLEIHFAVVVRDNVSHPAHRTKWQ